MATLLLSAVAGILSHVLYFNRGEHHLWGPTYIRIYLLGFIGTAVAIVKLSEQSIFSSLSSASILWISYFVGLYSSLLVYRLFFNQLNKFPGPWQARLSRAWFSAQQTRFDGHLVLERLHKKYGKYVRVGPSDLSISDADFHDVAFGSNTKFRKGEWYDMSFPASNLHTTRDKAFHDRRRRIWAPAFSDKALRSYEPKVRAFNEELIQRVREHEGKSLDMSKWFDLYAFDVMGQLAFGKDYNMLRNGERHWALDLLVQGMEAVTPKMPMWLFRTVVSIPFAAKKRFEFLEFCAGELEQRVESKSDGDGDITGWLLKGYEGVEKPAKDPMFRSDSRLIVIAGSDTSAAALTYLFYELAKKPDEVKKLREELRPLTQGEWGDVDIRQAPLLNGAINEALRLHPPVPSGLERKVPPGGVQVGDVWLPGEVKFWMPQYVIGKDEDYYEKALEFMPERWSTPDMIKHKTAFAPFSLGSENCIGKNLAYMEMRTLSTQLLLNFDVGLAPGEDGSRLIYQTKDHFTLGLAPLELVFTPALS